MGLLKDEHPKLFSELLVEENLDTINPETVTSGSSKKVMWECSTEKHKFPASINNRTRKGSGCPYCSGRLPTPDNCLEVKRPIVAAFLADKSQGEKLTANSRKKVKFKCDNGDDHAWEAKPIDYRNVKDKSICPFCSHRQVLKGFNDLETLYPEIAAQWSDKNNSSPSDFVPESRETVTWVCDKDSSHEWDTQIHLRTIYGAGCHACWGRKVIPGSNDVPTTHPEVVHLWDAEKNDKPLSEYTAGSNDRAYWVCESGHEYEAVISKVALGGQRCAVCVGQKIIPGYNDLLTLHPHVKEIWDWEENTVDPSTLSPHSHTRVHWKCKEHGHKWITTPGKINSPSGCPVCANQRVVSGFNDFASRYPELMEQ